MNFQSLGTIIEEEEIILFFDHKDSSFSQKKDTNNVNDKMEKLVKLREQMLTLSSELEKLRMENKTLIATLNDESYDQYLLLFLLSKNGKLAN